MLEKKERGSYPLTPIPVRLGDTTSAEPEPSPLSGASKEDEKQTTDPRGLRFSIVLQRSALPEPHKAWLSRKTVMSVGVLVFMGGMWGFLGAFCVPWDDPTCPGDTQDYQIQKWEGPRTFCPCPHFTGWQPIPTTSLFILTCPGPSLFPGLQEKVAPWRGLLHK